MTARVALLAPSPILTVTLEQTGAEPEIHIHPGGQGYWVARMLQTLRVHVAVCAPLGGEIGAVLRVLMEKEGLELHGIDSGGWNGAYVHDRRSGERLTVGKTRSPALSRHETDALYSAMATASLGTRLAVLTGPRSEDVIHPHFYRRLAGDLRRNGCAVAADLSGPYLAAALAGGVDVLHLSERELGEHVGAAARGVSEIAAAMERLRDEGARNVIVSRGPEPALALLEHRLVEVSGPVFEAHEHRGSGDSMFAAVIASMGRGDSLDEALRMGAAAGAVNVLRRGLGSGSREDVERLAGQVSVRVLDADQ